MWITFRVSFGYSWYNKDMLTGRQKQILDFINFSIEKRGIAPTLEETAKHFRLSSVATVHEHIQALQKKGAISKRRGQARAIEPWLQKEKLVTIPLLGLIAAGGPIGAIRNPEPMEVPRSMLSRGTNHYALKVSGTSMIEEGISDGDIVIIREQQTVEDGEKAVVYLPDKDTVTLKKIYRDKNRVRLVPANKFMKPFYEKNVEVQGKVVGVLRNEF